MNSAWGLARDQIAVTLWCFRSFDLAVLTLSAQLPCPCCSSCNESPLCLCFPLASRQNQWNFVGVGAVEQILLATVLLRLTSQQCLFCQCSRQDNPIQCIFCQKTPVQLPHCTCFQLRLCKVWYCSKITASCLTLYFSAPWRATGRLRVVYASKKSWKSSNLHTASHIFIHLHTHLPFSLVHPAAVNTVFNNSYKLEGFNVSVFVLVL